MEYIDNEIFNIEGVSKKRKSPLIPIIVLIIGILMVWKSTELDLLLPSIEIGGALTAIGGMLVAYGLICLLIVLKTKKRIPLYNGKPLIRKELFYESNKLTELKKAVTGKKIDEINKIKTSSTSAVILVSFESKDGKFKAMQVQEYVPHQHIPTTDTIVF